MYYYSKKSRKKVIHKCNCFHYKCHDPKNFGTFYTIEEARSAGYKICKHCSAIHNAYRNEYKKLEKFAVEQGLSFFLSGEELIIFSTSKSKWKIISSKKKNKLILYHKNTQSRKSDKESAIEGYHIQKQKCNTLLEYMKLIIEHDSYRDRHPLQKTTKKEMKTPPPKGSKRYNKQQKTLKKQLHKKAVQDVLNLIDLQVAQRKQDEVSA